MTTEAVKAIFEPQEPKTPEQPPVEATPVVETPEKDTHDILRELQNQPEPQPAPEPQPNAREELYQTRYQTITDKLKRFPKVYQEIMSDVKGKAVEPPKPKTQPEDFSGDVSYTPQQLAELLRNTVREETGQLLKRQRQEDFFALERQAADEAIAEFEKAGVAQNEMADAYKTVVSEFAIDINQPGGPSRAIALLGKELEIRELRKRSGNRTQTASEEAKAKLEQAKLVAQPAPSSPSGPTEQSYERKVFEMMKNAGNPDAKKAIFKG
jgi:hypothetical protein